MAQRTVCLCDGKYIGIETIYTVINGRQVNIPEKLKELRAKSQNSELFCPCGCGANLILVAGDKNLREQHFRLKDGAFNQECHVITEGRISVDSKIVLKCWLDDKLKPNDLEMRVPIQAVDGSSRKYEFSFLSRDKKVALSYCHERVNLSDEKLEILEGNSQGIHIIYVVDAENGGSDGQYPEGLMKIQNKQKYCLLLEVADAEYSEAMMKAIFYAKDIDGLWREILFAEGYLSAFSIDDNGCVIFEGEILESKRAKAEADFNYKLEMQKIKRVTEEKQQAENLKKLLEKEQHNRQERQRLLEEAEKERRRQREEAKKQRAELEEKRRVEEEKRQAEIHQREEDFKCNMESDFSQQETQVRDADGNRWIKCEFCGKIANENEFTSYGGAGHINLGTCKACKANNPAVKQKTDEKMAKIKMKYDPDICPACGGTLREKSGKFGKFMGCSNYPKCRYTGKIRPGK